ncbi:MAG: hypothetical protein R2911_38640 [Caldilineaceae bacterium]
MKTHFEYIVLGCGGIGALYWLSRRRGPGCAGRGQFKLFHDNGGSQDRSRIIHYYYPEPPPVSAHAYDAWATVADKNRALAGGDQNRRHDHCVQMGSAQQAGKGATPDP